MNIKDELSQQEKIIADKINSAIKEFTDKYGSFSVTISNHIDSYETENDGYIVIDNTKTVEINL